jgi:hypothetical protein
MDDGVNHSMLHQEFTALEPFRKFLTNRLFDHPRPGKSNQRAGFGDVEISQHGEACGHAPSCRIGKNGDIRKALAIEVCQSG